MEYTIVVFGVVLAIVAPAFAIVACVVLVVIALYVIRLKCGKKKEEEEKEGGDGTEANKTKNSGETKDLEWEKDMEWEKADPSDVERQSTVSVAKATNEPPPAEAFIIGTLEDVPLDKPIPKYDAKTF